MILENESDDSVLPSVLFAAICFCPTTTEHFYDLSEAYV